MAEQFQQIEVNGEIVEFPATMSDDEIAQVLAGDTPPSPEAPLTDRLAGAYESGVDRAASGMEAIGQKYGDVGAQDVLMQSAAGGIKMIGQGGMEITKELWNMLPQAFTGPAEALGSTLAQSPYFRAPLELLNKGYEYYDDWAQKHPAEAAQFGAAFDVGALSSPRLKPGRPDFATKVATKELDRKVRNVQSLLEPDVNTGDGRWREEGLGRSAVYEPTESEMEMYRRVEMDVPNFSPNRTYRKNAEWTLDVVKDTRKELDSRIVAEGNPMVDIADTIDALDEAIADLPNSRQGTALVGDKQAQDIANRLLEEGRELLLTSDGTALGVMNARREFDSLVAEVLGNGVYDPSNIKGANVATRIIRNEMNERVIDAVPNALVHDLLDKQHQLIKAHDVLNSRATKELRDAFSRSMSKLRSFDLVPSTFLGLAAATGAVAGSPVMASISLGAGGLYLGGRMVGLARSRQVLGQMAASIEKAIPKVQSAADKAALRADRAMLLEYLKGLDEEEEQ